MDLRRRQRRRQRGARTIRPSGWLDVCRRVSTPEGRQKAVELKRNGVTFEALADRYAQKLFSKQSAAEVQRLALRWRSMSNAG